MNTKLRLIVSIIAVASLRSTALAVDNRFDGIWVGTESVKMRDFHGSLPSEPYDHKTEPYEHKTPAKIVIAQGGTLLGVLEGYCPGRYNDVKRAGNTIVFHASNRTGELSLSADGQTLIEKGRVPGSILIGAGARQGALSGHQRSFQSSREVDIPGLAKSTAEVTGTFHRQK
jgi:hypothetical protein